MIEEKFRKYVLFVALIGGLTASAGQAIAQKKVPTGNVKFAVVNFQKIFRDSAATRSIAPQIEKLKKSFETQFIDIRKKLQQAEKDLQGQRAILSPEAYAEKQEAFKNQVNGVQRNVQTVQRMIGRAEKSLDLIFPRSGLIHVDARYDISNEVLKRLDKKLPFVKVKKPPEREGGARAPAPKKK
jgi:Skp family chaperone for outer membrane proteins